MEKESVLRAEENISLNSQNLNKIKKLIEEIRLGERDKKKEREKIEKLRKMCLRVENHFWQGLFFLEIAKISKNIEDLNRAKESSLRIIKDSLKDEFSFNLIKTLLFFKEIEEARKITLEMKDGYLKCLALLEIAKTSKNNEDLDTVRKIAEFHNPFLEVIIFTDLFRISKNFKDLKKALRALLSVEEYLQNEALSMVISSIECIYNNN